MARNCDFYMLMDKKDWCAIKKDEISYDTYKNYCKNDYSKQCPFYQMMKERER